MQEYSLKSRLLKDILNVQEFKVPPEEIKELYPRAYALPSFFLANLVSDERVVKCFTGKEALVHAFYYQLMKLGLEIEVENKNYRDILYDKFVKFDYIDEGELEDQLFSDFQYRKFMKDFIEIIERQNIPNFQQKAEEFPIIDQILKRIFKIIVPYPMIVSLQRPESSLHDSAKKLLTYLCQQFKITLREVGPCFKFQESDVFVYLQNADEVYLAFNDEFIGNDEFQDNLSSTFKCGEGNSFVTKYHSQSEGHSSDFDKTAKRFNKSKYWNKDHPQNSSIAHYHSKFKESPMSDMKHISYSGNDSEIQEHTKIEIPQPKQTESIRTISQSVHTSGCFNPIMTFSNKEQKQALYKQFTNTFILQQLSPKNKENISSIKNHYRVRQSIHNQF